MKLLHIGDGVYFSAWPENVCVFGGELGGDYPGFVFALFEVRVGEAEEDAAQGGVGEVVWEEFHGVCAEGGDVLVG